MKSILLENNGLLSTETDVWAKSLDPNYKMINPSVREYSRENDLFFFAMLINPSLENIITSSAFVTQMPHQAMVSFGKIDDNAEDYYKQKFMQLEYFSWLLFNALRFRERAKYPGILSVHINYEGESFLEALKEEELGKDVTMYMRLMLRQQENVQFLIYKDYQVEEILSKEEDLKLD